MNWWYVYWWMTTTQLNYCVSSHCVHESDENMGRAWEYKIDERCLSFHFATLFNTKANKPTVLLDLKVLKKCQDRHKLVVWSYQKSINTIFSHYNCINVLIAVEWVNCQHTLSINKIVFDILLDYIFANFTFNFIFFQIAIFKLRLFK